MSLEKSIAYAQPWEGSLLAFVELGNICAGGGSKDM
jgi:hypothetical protein